MFVSEFDPVCQALAEDVVNKLSKVFPFDKIQLAKKCYFDDNDITLNVNDKELKIDLTEYLNSCMIQDEAFTLKLHERIQNLSNNSHI